MLMSQYSCSLVLVLITKMCIGQKDTVLVLVPFPKTEYGSKAMQRCTATPLQIQIQNAHVYVELFMHYHEK